MMNNALKVVLLDDELLALSYLRNICEGLPQITVVKVYNDPTLFLSEKDDIEFDFCISDIVMPKMNGLELANELKQTPIIFTTAHNQFAADAFDIDAVDYLRKPVSKERLERAIEKVQQKLVQKKDELNWSVTTSKGQMSIRLTQIISFSTDAYDRRDKMMLLSSGEKLIIKNKSFDQLVEALHPLEFVRISKSEILNLKFIQGFQGEVIFSEIKAENGKPYQFVLSETYKKKFLDQFKAKQK